MIAASIWLFAGATALVSLTPGPNVLFIVSQSVRSGFGKASWSVLGMAASPLLYLAVAVAGLSLLLESWPSLFLFLRLGGAAYLSYLGIRMLRSAFESNTKAMPVIDDAPFLKGFATSFGNPKTLLYFSAFLPQFANPAHPLGPQLAELGLLGIGLEVVILLGYARLAATARWRRSTARLGNIEFATGLFFIALGIYLAVIAFKATA
jgi:threonine/homoserine/homoserine lactone efflux protein